MSTRSLLLKYPFIARPGDLGIGDLDLRVLVESMSDRLREVFPRVFKDILGKRAEVNLQFFESSDESLACYMLLLAVAKALNDTRLLNRIAIAYAKTAARTLVRESGHVIRYISLRVGVNVEFTESPDEKQPARLDIVEKPSRRRVNARFKPLQYSIPLLDYVRIVAERLSQNPAYSLENNIVANGRVYVDEKTITRILEEAIVRHVLAQAEEAVELVNGPVLEAFVSEARRILDEAGWYKKVSPGSLAETIEGVNPEALPPCIKRIISLVDSGGNPSHEERFNLAAFLANIGLSVDAILEYFKKTPDFNERIARYQVEHIAGLRGSRKKYMPYNCESMKSAGICPVDGQCKGGRNPLAVYKYNLKAMQRKPASRAS